MAIKLFDIECPSCDHRNEVALEEWTQFVACPTCGDEARVLLGATKHFPFHAGWYRDIAWDPIYIDSKRQLREACKKHGCSSVYLEDN